MYITDEGQMRFSLPAITPLCQVQRARQKEIEKIVMNLDTVFIEPDRYRFCLVWRGTVALSALSDAGIEKVAITTKSLKT